MDAFADMTKLDEAFGLDVSQWEDSRQISVLSILMSHDSQLELGERQQDTLVPPSAHAYFFILISRLLSIKTLKLLFLPPINVGVIRGVAQEF